MVASGAVIVRPRLWVTALRQVRRMAPRGWYRRPPFVPVPDRAWLAFRLTTMYGDASHRPDAHAIVAWLEWARRIDRR